MNNSEHEKILEMFLKEQQERINELTQQVMMLTTRNKYLDEQNAMLQKKVERFEVINIKKKNSISNFIHKPQTIR